ncbi:MAG: hypothetical protein ABSG62_21420, partial [Terracidiphilus sp.]
MPLWQAPSMGTAWPPLVTQITSKAGSNKIHGSAFEDFQANYLTARTEFQNYNDPLNGYITPYTRNEFGGAVG